MRQRTLLLIALFITVCCSSSSNNKVSVRLHSLLDSPQHSRSTYTSHSSHYNEEVYVWVYFKDKGEYTMEHALEQLKPAARHRRSLKSLEYDLVNEEDIPVSSEYIKQVEETDGVTTVRRASKWLNAVSVATPFSSLSRTVDKLSKLSFVEKLDVVASYTRKSVPVERILSSQELRGKRVSDNTINYGDSTSQLQMLNVPAAHSLGYNGTGVTIVILDSGYEKYHPALSGISIIGERDFIENDDNTQSSPPDVQNVHGTATLSVVGGWAPGKIIGSGFGAKFLLAKTEIVANETRSEEDNFIAAIEWGEAHGADIVSASLGYTMWYSYYSIDGTVSPVTKACDMASKRGVVVVVSAGNADSRGIATPADGFEVISVGAVTADNTVSGFSSNGPAADGRIKPDVSARGSSVLVANAKDVPTISDKNNDYTQSSGTSFSCPLVAGVVAILLQAHPDWTPRMVKEALQLTASQAASPDILQGWGIVNVLSALSYTHRNGTCSTYGCSDHGCCVDGECKCQLGYFGIDCSFKKLPCKNFCNSRTGGLGICLKQASGNSYRCAEPGSFSTLDPDVNPECSGCPRDACGDCFGSNSTCLVGCDGVVNSTLVFDYCGVCNGTNTTCVVPSPVPPLSSTSAGAFLHAPLLSSFFIAVAAILVLKNL